VKPCPRINVLGVSSVEASVTAKNDVNIERHLPLTLHEIVIENKAFA
jgi:predicted protein tyrosine phosphatase